MNSLGIDLDFPLILVLLTFASGLIWLADAVFLAPGRKQALARLRRDYPDWEREGSKQRRTYMARAAKFGAPLLAEYAKAFFPVLAFVLVLRSFLVEPFQIPSPSMAPTLEKGDFILVNKYAYGIRLPISRAKVLSLGAPKRGDVLVFFPPHQNKSYFIKRVVGLPGDHISYNGKQLFVNGRPVARELLEPSSPPSSPAADASNAGRAPGQLRFYRETAGDAEYRTQEYPARRGRDFSLRVKAGHYFMMGDNRDNSQDSRFWGQVPERDLVGRAFAIWMHWDSFFSWPSFNRAGRIH